jgi:phosphocarrier protein HPr
MEVSKKILNEEGMHARPAGVFAKAASAYQSKIELIFKDRVINAKSSMSLMTLGLAKDSEITLRADGPDAPVALESLSRLIDNQFKA